MTITSRIFLYADARHITLVRPGTSQPHLPDRHDPKYECLGNDHDARTIGTMFGGISSLDAVVVASAR
jgi:hypothetical protein